MRITTSMMSRNYMRSLNDATGALSKASIKSTNFRKFQSVSDNPAGATKAFQLRREFADNQNYLDNAEELDGRMKTAESAVLNVQEMIKDVRDRMLNSMNDPNQEDRAIFAKELKSIQGSILQEMNTSYSGQYLFGGTEGSEAPFVVGDDGRLLYRNQSVDNDIAMGKLSSERVLVDLGFGIDANDGNSGFDASLPGINFLGFGKNQENGLSQNLYNLIGEIADYLVSDEYNAEDMGNNITQFDSVSDNFLEKLTDMGSKSHNIEYTINRLKTAELNIKEKINYVEFVSPEEAISEFKMQEFTYRSTLAIGTKIIQPSLIDFMR